MRQFLRTFVEPLESRALLAAAGPVVVSTTPAGTSTESISSFKFVFDRAMDPTSFSVAGDVAAFAINTTGDLRSQITGFSWLDGNTTLLVTFNEQRRDGGYIMDVGPNILSATGQSMDQDADGVAGEPGADAARGAVTVDRFVGPDAFGYVAAPTAVPAIPDLQPGGAGVVGVLAGTDDDTAEIPLGGNTVRFYGVEHSAPGSLFVSTNGLITFGGADPSFANGNLLSSPAFRTIAALWDDWTTIGGPADSQVLYRFDDTAGDAAPERLVIQWHNVVNVNGSAANPATFRAILPLNTGASSGDIVVHYLDVDVGLSASTFSAGATVGIRDAVSPSTRRLLLSPLTGGSPYLQSGRAFAVSTAPTASVAAVTTPRATPVTSIQITFDKQVSGFDLSDLELLRDGGSNLLTAGGGATLTTADNRVFTLGGLGALTSSGGFYSLQLLPGHGIVGGPEGKALVGDIVTSWTNTAPTPPVVTAVFVAGTAWTSAYRNSLVSSGTGEAAFGYRINPAEQTRTMAWSNLNQVSVRFSENVVVASDNLALGGVNVASYGVSTFAYDPVTFTATWTLSQTIANDKVTIELDADAGTGVTDTAGNFLDGEWTNPVPPSVGGDAFPSGNGSAGGDFVFDLRVLPGDIDRNGTVNVFDFNVLRPNLNKTGLGVLAGDINGDNVVNIFDFNDLRTHLNRTTPA